MSKLILPNYEIITTDQLKYFATYVYKYSLKSKSLQLAKSHDLFPSHFLFLCHFHVKWFFPWFISMSWRFIFTIMHKGNYQLKAIKLILTLQKQLFHYFLQTCFYSRDLLIDSGFLKFFTLKMENDYNEELFGTMNFIFFTLNNLDRKMIFSKWLISL